MKMPGLFALTKREQRVVILIVVALLAGTIATHYRELRSSPAPVASPSKAPSPSDQEEDSATPNESP